MGAAALPRRRAWIAAALAAALGAAACGSTHRAASARKTARGHTAVSAGAEPAPDAGAATSVPGASTASSIAGSALKGKTTTTLRPGQTTTTAPGGGSGLIPAGPGVHGVTATTIEVGLWYLDSAAANAAIAALSGNTSNPASGDFAKGARAVVDYINAHGGLAGRQIVPVIHQVSTANNLTKSGTDQESQSACVDWTQDHHVFAMQNAGGADSLPCALATRTVVLSGVLTTSEPWLTDDMFRQAHDLWYGSDFLLAARHGRALVEALWRQGSLGPGARVGIMVEDTPGSKASAGAMVGALGAHGVRADSVVQIVYPDRFQSNWQSYVLQLQTAAVDHVLWAANTGTGYSVMFMMRAADNQQYFPQWGTSTTDDPALMAFLGAPHDQMANTHGMGWAPSNDLGDTTPQSPNAALCQRIGQDSGQGTAVNFYCEDLFFLKYALERAAEISPAGMSAALAKVGSGFASVQTLGGASFLAPDRHDGASTYRVYGYDSRCNASNCWKYVTPPEPLP
jgi:hypothetical protein